MDHDVHAELTLRLTVTVTQYVTVCLHSMLWLMSSLSMWFNMLQGTTGLDVDSCAVFAEPVSSLDGTHLAIW